MDKLLRINRVLFFILAVFTILHFGSSFLIPFLFGIFLAFLITPFTNYIEKMGIPNFFASLISTLVIFIVAGSLLTLVVYQINHLVSDFPAIRDELQKFLDTIQSRIAYEINIPEGEQDKIVQNQLDTFWEDAESYIANIFGSVLNTLIGFLLLLIYLLLMLLYRRKAGAFLMMYTKDENKEKVREVKNKISRVVFHYLLGRLKVMSILAVLYYITFLLFDLPYAILLTIFGAIITIIPYLGPLISGTLPILFSILFFDSPKKIILFASLVIIIQLIESYVLEPLILGKEVQLNPLVVIVAVIIGGMIWGLAGMILFVPLFAMFKIVSNNVPGLEPVGFLLGDSSKKGKNGQAHNQEIP